MKNLSDRFLPFLNGHLNTIPFFSESEFSMHQVLETLLDYSGPANVCVSSFSISEVALRSFVRLKESGRMQNFHCLLDLSVKRHRLGLLFFASNFISELGLAKNHAKYILIESVSVKWVVVGSANLNVNDKNEAGLLTREPMIYHFFASQFSKCFDKSLKVSPNEFN